MWMYFSHKIYNGIKKENYSFGEKKEHKKIVYYFVTTDLSIYIALKTKVMNLWMNEIAIPVQSWSTSRKRKEAWLCGQSKWSIFCTGCTKTPTGYVLCYSRHESRRNSKPVYPPIPWCSSRFGICFFVVVIISCFYCRELWLFLLKPGMAKKEWMRSQ